MIDSSSNLPMQLMAGVFDHHINIGRDRCLDATDQEKIRDGEVPGVRRTSEGVTINERSKIDACELTALEEKLCLIFHTYS
ncbi:hypothetical protein GCM10009105_16570 [Dokdonella soli]|uniref:Uncharacterized protein n=1 Tax=Dokdonella soli TaxID=529810 RepID=A0ABP3TMY5_9GAMM